MITTSSLLSIADRYKAASGVALDTTVSHRVFGDSKKLSALRDGAGITVDRFNAALLWFADNWPEGHKIPDDLQYLVAGPSESRGSEGRHLQGNFTGKSPSAA